MHRHLDFAQRCVDRGDAAGLSASTDLILLSQVNVYVDPTGSTPQALTAVDKAMATWSRVLNGDVKFLRVPSAKLAQVVIRFKPSLSGKGGQYGGFTSWKRSVTRTERTAAWSFHADMSLRTLAPSGTQMNGSQVLQAVLHEFGHVLGLDDSDDASEVMAPLDLAHPVTHPAESEVETLRSLRSKATDLRVLLIEARH
jgi:predicted Zn-dependent protease